MAESQVRSAEERFRREEAAKRRCAPRRTVLAA
jgi:hypothetical protein